MGYAQNFMKKLKEEHCPKYRFPVIVVKLLSVLYWQISDYYSFIYRTKLKIVIPRHGSLICSSYVFDSLIVLEITFLVDLRSGWTICGNSRVNYI